MLMKNPQSQGGEAVKQESVSLHNFLLLPEKK